MRSIRAAEVRTGGVTVRTEALLLVIVNLLLVCDQCDLWCLKLESVITKH